MNLYTLINTRIATHQVGTMTQRGIVEIVVALSHRIFVTNPHRQPIAAIFLHLERHLYRFVSVRTQRRFHQGKSVAVALGRFDGVL